MVRDPRQVHVHAIRHPRGCRSYVVVDPETHAACVVDPLLDHLKETLEVLSDQKAQLRWIVDTHAHGDHLSGAAALQARAGGEVVAHPASETQVASRRVQDGEALEFGEHPLVVHHAPGITRDALVLEAAGALFTGDTLLIGTVGLRDAPGSDPHAWYETLDRVFGEREEETVVHPGHDDMGRDMTTIAAERRGNRWLREDDREAFLALYRADERQPRKDADHILAANREGLSAVPRDVDSASGFAPPTTTAEAGAHAKRIEDVGAGANPSGVAGLLVVCGGLCAVGTVLGWMLAPQFHALSLVAAVILLGTGVSALEARRRSRGPREPDFYYTGPSKFTGPPPE